MRRPSPRMRAAGRGGRLGAELHDYLGALARNATRQQREVHGQPPDAPVTLLSAAARQAAEGERAAREAALQGVLGRIQRERAERDAQAADLRSLEARIRALEGVDFRPPAVIEPPGPPDTVIVVDEETPPLGTVINLPTDPANSPFVGTLGPLAGAPAPGEGRTGTDWPRGDWTGIDWTITPAVPWAMNERHTSVGLPHTNPYIRLLDISLTSPGLLDLSLTDRTKWRARFEFLDAAGDPIMFRWQRGDDELRPAAAAAAFTDVPLFGAHPGLFPRRQASTLHEVFMQGDALSHATVGWVVRPDSERGTANRDRTFWLWIALDTRRRRAARPTDPRTLRVRLFRRP